MVQAVRGFIGLGLMLGVGALPAAAQGLALPAADPVGIARSGAQVAYGYSLEAAGTNPAILSSLKETWGFYLATGLEMAETQQTLESNQQTYNSFDRNRTIGGFGLSNRISSGVTLGLKLDEPYLRHARLLDAAPSRFLGDGIDLSARRLEAQAAWSLSPNLSVGIGLGVARLAFDSSTVMRLGLPVDPTQVSSAGNPVDGLVDHRVGQSGNKVVPSYSLGLRWALSPRWTLGFAHQSGLKGDLDLKASLRDNNLGLYANDGLSTPSLGTDVRATSLVARSSALPGSGTMELPSRTTFGMRHRATPMVTWEADLRWISGSLQIPSNASIQTPSGVVIAPTTPPKGVGRFGLGGSIEVELGKFWTLRAGLSLDQRSTPESLTEPQLGGTPSAAFSIGAGYKVMDGELSFGYQFRQSQDQDSRNLSGGWSSAGYRNVGTRVREEGMGHLLAIGFKKMF